MFTRVLRSADAVGGGGAAKPNATGEGARATGPISEAAARAASPKLDSIMGSYFAPASALNFDFTDDAARSILEDCAKFLWQLAQITSGVIATVDVSAFRKIVADNAPMPGRPVTDSAQAEPERDHRKNPRGRKHPLMTLVQFALQGVRMLLQITAAVNPNVHGKESFEQKQTRQKLKEEERELSNILNGRI